MSIEERFGFIRATDRARSEEFLYNFGVSKEKYLETPDVVSEEACRLRWNQVVTQEGEYGWLVERAPANDHPAPDEAIPIAVELHLFGRRLINASGRQVLITRDKIPYCGGLNRYGIFLMEPTVSVYRLRKRRLSPDATLRRALRSERFRECDLMQGFAMCAHGIWSSHAWLIRPGGKIVDFSGRHCHYFGSKVSLDALDNHYSDEHDVDC